MRVVQIVTAVLLLIVLVVVIATPGVYYPPPQRTILYLLASLLIGLVIGAEAGTKFNLDMKWFAFTTGGAAAVVIFLCWWLTYLSKPDIKIAVYQVLDESGQPLQLDWNGAVELPTMPNGGKANAIIQANEVVLIYPEQFEQQDIRVRKTPDDPGYTATLAFSGVRQFKLTLGRELTRAAK